MIGKVMTGRSFGGAVRYNLQKEDAVLLAARGIRTDSIQSITDDFNLQRKINKELGKAVGHIALSWSLHDKDKLTPDVMVERAKEYMQLMDIKKTQYVIVQHNDKQHPHLHIIYNRVSDNGKTISDRFQKQRNSKVAKEMTLKYGYYLAENKTSVNREQLKGADSLKYDLYDKISEQVKHARSWQQLEARLQGKSIGIIYKYKSGSGGSEFHGGVNSSINNTEIQGISFSKDGIQFKGSQLDRSLSYGNINKQLISNNRQETLAETIRRTVPNDGQPQRTVNQETSLNQDEAAETANEHADTWLIEELFGGFGGGADTDDDAYKRKKRNNNNNNDNQMGR